MEEDCPGGGFSVFQYKQVFFFNLEGFKGSLWHIGYTPGGTAVVIGKVIPRQDEAEDEAGFREVVIGNPGDELHHLPRQRGAVWAYAGNFL